MTVIIKNFLVLLLASLVGWLVLNLDYAGALAGFWLGAATKDKTATLDLLAKELETYQSSPDPGKSAVLFLPLSEDRTPIQPLLPVEPGRFLDDPSAFSRSQSYFLEIPYLKIAAPIILEPSTDLEVIYRRLEEGAVHYAGTPKPGEKGTAVILGHSSSYPWYRGNYGSVFALLSKLPAGEKIYLRRDHELLTYRVKRSLIFSPAAKDKQTLRELESTDGSSLVLLTCWPTGTNIKRVAVRADLI